MAALSARHCHPSTSPCTKPPTPLGFLVSMAPQRDGHEQHEEGTTAPEQERHAEEEGDDHSNEDEDQDEDDEEDCFFESLDRVPSRVSFCLRLPSSSSSDEDDDEDDVRISFASAIGPPAEFRCLTFGRESDLGDIPEHYDADLDGKDLVGNRPSSAGSGGFDYGVWMSQTMCVKERRRRLLQGMGLASRKDLASRKERSAALGTISSRKGLPPLPDAVPPAAPVVAPASGPTAAAQPAASVAPSSPQLTLSRCRSDSHLDASRRCPSPCPVLLRASSSPPSFSEERAPRGVLETGGAGGEDDNELAVEVCRVKNLDNGKEFVISDLGKEENSGRTNDTATGVSTEEFERFFGYSPIIKELMRRANLGGGNGLPPVDPKLNRSKNLKSGSRKKSGGWLKNIKSVANSVTWLIAEKEKVGAGTKANNKSTSADGSSEFMKVRQHGKSHKELTGLYMCQEIQAHQGSIWTMKFSSDGRFLASAGEDRVVQVWQVQECETSSSSLRSQDVRSPTSSRQLVASGSAEKSPQQAKKAKKGKNSERSLPDHIVMPDAIFSLSEKPFCSFEGHLDDVLDLSWSISQHLLSSSMDKTVRMWDLETKTCLKLFAHNDYVTCIQFNPMDDRYFISGSLDAKIRIWNVPTRKVVDWTDLHEMVTATCFTPDGQGAIVGSHKGSCRIYKITGADYKLSQECQIDIRNKKKKSPAKKITGFQFAPGSPSEVLVTSADSQIRMFDGVDMIHKFRGFRNTSSQIAASYTSDGKYVVCASEDSHVYVWKREQTRSAGTASKGKSWSTTRSYEHFYCKDVCVAVPWPSAGSSCAPISVPSLSGSSNQQDCPGDSQRSTSTLDDCQGLQPPAKNSSEPALPCAEDPRNISRSGSQIGSESFASASASQRPTDPATTLTSSCPKGNNCADAWGLVVVTASLEGDIRVYQNFGMPLRLSRQNNLF